MISPATDHSDNNQLFSAHQEPCSQTRLSDNNEPSPKENLKPKLHKTYGDQVFIRSLADVETEKFNFVPLFGPNDERFAFGEFSILFSRGGKRQNRTHHLYDGADHKGR